MRNGFTLIEISIVLVIIGLIVGGVLVGQHLIRAAQVRAQISQIDKYNTAVHAFQLKYNDWLPGDIPDPQASNSGLAARGQYAGEGDGNNVIEGVFSNAPGQNYSITNTGESVMFWVDLSTAHLIDGGFSAGSPNTSPGPGNVTPTSTPTLDAYLPQAKIGNGNYIYVFSWNKVNYYGLSAVTILGLGIQSFPGLTVQQAYSIDKKIDDGYPQTGEITAQFFSNYGTGLLWAAGGGGQGASDTSATAGSSTTCYDNGNSAGATQLYSLAQNNGNGVNCALSFRFQ